jgi:hypothetical protein
VETTIATYSLCARCGRPLAATRSVPFLCRRCINDGWPPDRHQFQQPGPSVDEVEDIAQGFAHEWDRMRDCDRLPFDWVYSHSSGLNECVLWGGQFPFPVGYAVRIRWCRTIVYSWVLTHSTPGDQTHRASGEETALARAKRSLELAFRKLIFEEGGPS